MKRLLFIPLLLCLFQGNAQTRELDLETIWASGALVPEMYDGVIHMDDGEHYARILRDYSNPSDISEKIVLYKYGEETPSKTLFDNKDAPEGFGSISEFTLSKSGKLILFETEFQGIYRYSYTAVYYVYNTENKKWHTVAEGNSVMYGTLSPDEQNIAYVYENDLYFEPLFSGEGKQKAISTDGEEDAILNGRSDWVYEEEFTLIKAFEWSPDGKRIAWFRFDESEVKEYQLNYYRGNYPYRYVFKYPKVGEDNSLLSLHIYSLESGKQIDIDDWADINTYLPRMKWTSDPNKLSIQKLNRHQNHLEMYFIDASSGEKELVYEERDEQYVDIHDNLKFLDDNSFLWTSGKSGFNHLYRISPGGKETQITKGEWEVTKVYGDDGSYIYYQSTEASSLQRNIYKVKLNGKGQKKLSEEEGTNTAEFSKGFDFFINTHSTANKPHTVTLRDNNGKTIKTLVENSAFEKTMENYGFVPVEFFDLKTESGVELNASIMKPEKMEEGKKYPVFMTCYGGPGSQSVTDEWGWFNYYWYQMLVSKGYVVVTVDNRGTGGRGEVFKQSTYLQLGYLESEDQIAAAEYMAKQDYVDPERIGIWGWSFGGYLSALSLMRGNEVFSMAVSVAPVADWRLYDNIYTERFMRTDKENEDGYNKGSLFSYANQLKGDLLVIHGTFDDNVHPQNTFQLTDILIQNNIPFDSEFYPNKAHGISGGMTRLHLYNRITNYIYDNL